MGGRKSLAWVVLWLGTLARADLAGHVTGPDGGPLAGADVWVENDRDSSSTGAHTTTDANGQFVHATADRRSRAWVVSGDVSTPVAHVEAGRTLELRAVAGRRLRGQVVDPEGEPLSGVTVRVAQVHGLRLGDTAPPSAVTDAGGWYRLRGLPLAAFVELEASAPGRIAAGCRICPGDWPTMLALRPADPLAAATGIRGRVLCGAAPVAKTVVIARRGDRGRPAVTDDDGWFELHELAPGDWDIGLEQGRAPAGWLEPRLLRVHVAAGQTATATIALEPAGVLVGRVRQPNGEPAAKVGVTAEGGGRRDWAGSDKEGRFRIETAPGPVTVTCGGKQTKAEAKLPPAAPVALEFTVKLQPPAIGHVVMPDGAPVRGATVRFDRGDETETDDDGQFSVVLGEDASPPGIEVHWTGPDGQEWNAARVGRIIIEGEPEPPLRLVLSEVVARAVTGRAVDRAGLPVPGVLVGDSELWPQLDSDWFLSATRWTTTGVEGRYVSGGEHDARDTSRMLLGPAPEVGKRDLDQCVILARPGWRAVRTVSLSAPPQRTASDAVLELRDGRVAGRVIDAAGHGVAGAQLVVEDCPPEPDHITDAEGGFDLPLVPHDGRYALVAMSGERLVGKATVSADQSDVQIRLADGAPPSEADRRHAALRALDRLRPGLAGQPNPAMLTVVMATACALDAATGLAWIDQLPTPQDRRRAWAASLSALAKTQPQRALALLPEVAQVPDANLRSRVIGGLVLALPEPVPAEARQALAHEIQLQGGQPGVGGSPAAWANLLPAMARLGDDRTRPGLQSWVASGPRSRDLLYVVTALWFRPDLAALVLDQHGATACRLHAALALAKGNPRAAPAWLPRLLPDLEHLWLPSQLTASLAVALAPSDPGLAFKLGDSLAHNWSRQDELRGQIILAMRDRPAALGRLHEPTSPVLPGLALTEGTVMQVIHVGDLATSGSLVQAATQLDPPLARRMLVALRAHARTPEDDADLVPLAPNVARLDLELAASRAVTVPRQQGPHGDEFDRSPAPLKYTAHGRLLAAFCALDPERAVDLAGSELVPAEGRFERLLFVAQTLGGVEWLPY